MKPENKRYKRKRFLFLIILQVFPALIVFGRIQAKAEEPDMSGRISAEEEERSVTGGQESGENIMVGEESESEEFAALGEEMEQARKSAREELLQEMDFSEMDRLLAELFPEERIEFGEVIWAVMQGETKLDAKLLGRMIGDKVFYAFRINRESVIHLIVIAVGAAIFLNLSGVFQTRQVSEISFFLLYMLLIGICLTSFQEAADWVGEGIGQLTGFMKVLYPIYFIAVTAAKGGVTSSVFYHLALLLILLIDGLIVHVMLPLIHVYVMGRVLNSLQSEDYLSKFLELLEMVISWILKSMIGVVAGLNILQGLVAPAIDSLKRSMVTRGVEAIPGVGDALGGTAEVVLGTAVLIKNSIGVTGALICCALCMMPLIQIGVITLVYKMAAAVIQPVSDKRIVECVSGVGEGCRLLLRAVLTSGVLFLFTIAIAAYTTNGA
ncbi:MAG: stage III sporulation protein AF [Dorea sp.]|nr:stage III sporulation protein AF [Dorea sp.]